MGNKIYRKIIEKHLKRSLEPWEIVHHIDGNHFNNDIKNLRIVTFKEHIQIHQIMNRTKVKFKNNAETEDKINTLKKEIETLKQVNQDFIEFIETMKEQIVWNNTLVNDYNIANSMALNNLHRVLGIEREQVTTFSKIKNFGELTNK